VIRCGEARWRRDLGRPARGKGCYLWVGPTWQRREREEASLTDCANSKKRRLLANTPRLLRPSGPSACTAACGVKRAGTGEAGPDGPKSEKNYF
jgi:hypothetical protein